MMENWTPPDPLEWGRIEGAVLWDGTHIRFDENGEVSMICQHEEIEPGDVPPETRCVRCGMIFMPEEDG